MSDYTDQIAALSKCFNEFETSSELADYADFSKKYNAFLKFIDKEFPEDTPEKDKVIEEQEKLFQDKRGKIIEFFAKRTSHIPGLMTEEGKLTDEFVSFIFNQVDNSVSIDPPKPLAPSNTKLKDFYYPIYKNSESTAKRTRGEEDMEGTFTPSEIQKKACEYLGINPATITDEESLLKQFEGKIIIDGYRIIDVEMEQMVYEGTPETEDEKKLKESADYSLRDDGLDPSDLPLKTDEELNIHEGDTPLGPDSSDDMHWIDEKVRDYEQMKADGNTDIKTITPDKTAGTFTAEVDNGTVTYTSKNDVSITKDSSYKVFDTVMKEPSNAGKAIRMPTDASKEFKTNLFVAAILNNHKVNGIESLEFDQETFDKIGLTDEQKAKVLAALPERTEERTEEKVDEVSKDVKEAIEKLEEPKAKLAEMISSGKISASISSNAETKRNEIVFNFDPAKGGTQNDADEANKLLTEALKSVDELRQKTLPDDADARNQAITDNYAIKSAQLALIRSVYQPEPSEAIKAVDRIRAKKMGMIDDDGKPIKAEKRTAEQNTYGDKLAKSVLARLNKQYGE